jgi:hypothetical protein
MPAIQPARLKLQTAQLLENFADPPAFCRALDGLLDSYSDRTYRPGLAGEPRPLLPAYNAPIQVLRQVGRDLAPPAGEQRRAALALCDAMWQKESYEFRWLAAALLGHITPAPPEDILARIERWAKPSTEERLMDVLFQSGLARLRQEQPKVYLLLAEGWLDTGKTFYQHLGLKALRLLLDTPEAANLPDLFQQIAPLVRNSPASLRPDLLDILRALAELSPRETAYFLRQNLFIQQDNPGTAWLTRHSLDSFPADLRASLRAALREAR